MNTRHLRAEDLRGKRWRGLVRESSEAQAEKWSPERQRADLARAAEELGMIPVHPIYYERVGSGEEEGASELAVALRDGKAGEYDVLVVLQTSRFARNRAEAVRMKAEYRKAGVIIYFVAQRLISGTYAGGLTEGIHEVIDEQENETRRFWIAGGQRQRQLAGKWLGAMPFGYRRVLVDFADGTRGWDGDLEPDPVTAPIVRAIYDAAVVGRSGRNIAADLNARGVRNGGGRIWRAKGVLETLTNPVYQGRLVRYRRTWGSPYYERSGPDGYADLGAKIPPIIDEALWLDAQEAVRGRADRGGPRVRHFRYPLSGVLRCRSCGHLMTGQASETQRYYRCSGRASSGVCDQPSIRADEAEAQFVRWLGSYHLPTDWREAIARTTVQTVRSDERDRQARLGDRLKRLQQLYQWGDLEESDYREQSAQIKADMGVMAKPSITSLEAVAEVLRDLGPAWEKAPEEEQAALPRLILRSAEVANRSVQTWIVRAELKPLLDLCVLPAVNLYLSGGEYTVRFSA